MQKLLILAMCVAAATAASITQADTKGVVSWTRCGGVGTLNQVRIEGCEGASCLVYPGRVVDFEADLIPSSASPSLLIKVIAIWNGLNVPIINTELLNSSVQPGQLYVVRFSITPNDILSGSTVVVQASILHSNTEVLEICAGVSVRIN